MIRPPGCGADPAAAGMGLVETKGPCCSAPASGTRTPPAMPASAVPDRGQGLPGTHLPPVRCRAGDRVAGVWWSSGLDLRWSAATAEAQARLDQKTHASSASPWLQSSRVGIGARHPLRQGDAGVLAGQQQLDAHVIDAGGLWIKVRQQQKTPATGGGSPERPWPCNTVL